MEYFLEDSNIKQLENRSFTLLLENLAQFFGVMVISTPQQLQLLPASFMKIKFIDEWFPLIFYCLLIDS